MHRSGVPAEILYRTVSAHYQNGAEVASLFEIYLLRNNTASKKLLCEGVRYICVVMTGAVVGVDSVDLRKHNRSDAM